MKPNVSGAMVRRREQRRAARDAGPPPRIGSAVARFMLGSLLAIAVVVVGGFLALRSVAVKEAVRDTSVRVESEGRLVQTAAVDDALLHSNAASVAKLDEVVRGQVLDGSIVRVKIWARDGTILYADDHALIGRRYTLAADDRKLFDGAGPDAELSDLSKPENRLERGRGKLLEAYSIIHTPNGTPLLFEIYQRFSSVTASGHRLLRAEAPPLFGGLLVLLLFQVPLAWSLGRRLQRGHRDRAALLANAVEASAAERRRIASDLHDGVVQNVAGVAFGLAPLARAAERRGDDHDASELRRSISQLRQGIREMRTLLVEIHPPNLESIGLEAALHDLLSPLEAQGIATSLDIDVGTPGGDPSDALVYRVAREAVRNAQAHAEARSIQLTLSHPSLAATRLVVDDDGSGFGAADRERASMNGHVGLTLLEGLVEQAGGTLSVRSRPGSGTTVALELPSAPRSRPAGNGSATDSAGGGAGQHGPAPVERVVDDHEAVPG
ncbi:MAG: two-component system, NarL family, sensor kinase [Solirubrobacteraceae bacterium]|nr:two-component system, NarL family, sensor kinase [Solirubrobacteraceae bacterium]